MVKANAYALTGLIAAFVITGVSITGAAIQSNAEFCEDSLTRSCYELDAGPFSLAKLPAKARAMDSFILNPRAGVNKWSSCERTNPESVIETELTTTYCGDKAVEKVKTCQIGSSKVMLYYYTGQCRITGYDICNSMFNIPTDCVSSGIEGKTIASSLNAQLYFMGLPYPKDYDYGYCTTLGDYEVYMKQEIRRISSNPVIQFESDYWWVYEGNESCVEGNPLTADYKGQRRVGDILVDSRLLSDELSSILNDLYGIKWNYRLTINGCSDFPDINLEGNNTALIKCSSTNSHFCGCN